MQAEITLRNPDDFSLKVFLFAYRHINGIGMGQSRGYIQSISGVICLKGGSGKDVFCYLAMKNWQVVTILTTRHRDIVMFFRSWSLLQLIYSRTLNADFLVSAVICGKSSGKTASFRCQPFLNMKTWALFGLGSGASFVMLTDPNLVRGGTSRCAAFVPCAQALAGQVRQTFQTKGQHGLRQIMIKF